MIGCVISQRIHVVNMDRLYVVSTVRTGKKRTSAVSCNNSGHGSGERTEKRETKREKQANNPVQCSIVSHARAFFVVKKIIDSSIS